MSSKLKKLKFLRPPRIILKNAFNCCVRLERLSSDDIQYALKNGICRSAVYRNTKFPSHHLDHTYSKFKFANYHVLPSATQQEAKKDKPSLNQGLFFPSDSESDDYNDLSDDNESEAHVVDGKQCAYPPIDFDTVGENDQNSTVEQNEQNMSDDDDSMEEDNVEDGNDSGISGDSPEYSDQSSEMDSDAYNLSPDTNEVNNEALRFLNEIKLQLDEIPNESNMVFGEICLKFLTDSCYSTSCEFTHSLPDPEVIAQRLTVMTYIEVEKIQNQFLLQYDMLLAKYFTTFCEHYGREWQYHRDTLRRLIGVISQRPAPVPYLKDILNGLLASDVEYNVCVELMLIEFKEDLPIEEKFNMIWEIMIDSRNDKVVEQLKDFEGVLYGDELVAATVINRLMELQNNDEMFCLQDFTIKVLKKCAVTTFRRIDPNLMTKYIWHIKKYNLNASKFIQQRAIQFGVIND